MTLEITTRIGCRNNCAYCPQEKLIKAYNNRGDLVMSLDTFKKCIDKLPKEVDVEFSGFSESWLNSDCTEMVLYAHARGHKIRVYTTLVGMTLNDLEKLKAIPLKSFWIHLPDDSGQEKIIVDDSYLKVLQEASDFLESHKDKIDVSYHIRGKNVHPKIKQVLGDKIEKRVIGARAGNVDDGQVKTINRRKGKIGCKRELRQNVLLPNGDVALCCMDYGLSHILGNLLTDSYQSLFDGLEFKKVESGLNDEKLDTICRYCDMLSYDKSLWRKVINKFNK